MLRLNCLLMLACLLLAGCTGSKGAGDAATLGDDTAPQHVGQLLVDLTPDASVAAPVWQPGQWWDWEFTFGTETADETACSIVLAGDGSSYSLVTENTGWAKEEAAFGLPWLGAVAKADLAMQGWGGPAPGDTWSLLSFPLTDGKTWTAIVPNIAWDIVASDTAELAMSATFSDGVGEHGGFRLTGQVDGKTLVDGEYDPSTGWFAALRFFDVDTGEEGLEFGLRAKSTGLNYTGPYFQHTARPLVVFEDVNGFDDVPTEGGQPYTQAPQPYWPFTMGSGTTLYGYIVVDSVVGARTMVLVDPANGQRNLVSHGDVDDDEQGLFIDEPGIEGDWKLMTVGAGGFSGAFAELFEVTEGNFTM